MGIVVCSVGTWVGCGLAAIGCLCTGRYWHGIIAILVFLGLVPLLQRCYTRRYPQRLPRRLRRRFHPLP